MNEKKRLAAALALFVAQALLSAPAFAMTVYLEYDRNYDFSKIKTYSWSTPKVAETNPIIHQRIVNAINYELGTRGKQLVETDPDIVVTYNGNSREEMRINEADIVPTGWRAHSYYGTATDTIQGYRVGTLIVDAMDAKTGKLVWRGVAEGTIKPDADKIEKKINEALKKMAKQWDKLARKSS